MSNSKSNKKSNKKSNSNSKSNKKSKTNSKTLSIEEYNLFNKHHLDIKHDIKKNYCILQVRLHPDKGGNINEFKEMQALYEICYNL